MSQINKNKIPRHVAIIMDGNGRWAAKRRLPKIAGHRAGIKSIEEVIRAADASGVKVLTLYAFSTENWKRPKAEITALMALLDDYLDRETDRIASEGIRMRAIGRIGALDPRIQLKLRKLEEKTSRNEKVFVNIALNYGSRSEITDAARKMFEEMKERSFPPDYITEEHLSGYLYTSGLPDPDLLIRTSGEMRLSNFLLWQLSYAEIYVTKKFWPDFGKKDFEEAILEYQARERRYGG